MPRTCLYFVDEGEGVSVHMESSPDTTKDSHALQTACVAVHLLEQNGLERAKDQSPREPKDEPKLIIPVPATIRPA